MVGLGLHQISSQSSKPNELIIFLTQHGLLQRSSRRVAEVHNWHFTACAECSSSSRHKHWQVRPWPVESIFHNHAVTLAQRPRANWVQARCHGSPVSGEQNSDVLFWL